MSRHDEQDIARQERRLKFFFGSDEIMNAITDHRGEFSPRRCR